MILPQKRRYGIFQIMIAEEVLETVATMPREELEKIQFGIDRLLGNGFFPGESC
jgi:hypothetical protein